MIDIKFGSILVAIMILSILPIGVDAKLGNTNIHVMPIIDKESLISSPGTINVIIGFKDKVGPNEIAMLRSNGASIKRIMREINAISARIPSQAQDALRKNPKIKYVTENSNITRVSVQTIPWGINRINAIPVQTRYKGDGVIVAVTDTGIDYNHEDLVGKVIGGWDYVNNDPDPMDDFGHGTHVAGTIAANDNDIGVIGVAPNVSLFAMKMCNSGGSCTFDDAAASIIDSANSGAKIISMSWGCAGSSACDDPTEKSAIQYAYNQGVLLVAAAGNTYGGQIGYPANYSEVIAVTAVDQNDNIAAFSSIGPKAEVAAPGVDIPSTVPKGNCPLCNPTGYANLSGTSMSTPHVTGTAALIWSAYPWLTRDQVRSRIDDYSYDHFPAGRDINYGFGIVDAYNSIIQNPPPPPSPPYYMMIQPSYNWIDGITGGTQIQFDNPDDSSSGAIPIGMNFNFYGNLRSQLWVGTNGLIAFTNDSSQRYYWNSPIPNTNLPNNFLPVYWDDLYMDSPATAYYKLDTSSTPRKLIITWQNVRWIGGTNRTTFEAVLYEDGRILYQYQQPSLFEYGGETIGIEDLGGIRGLQYKFNERPKDYSAVLFTPILQSPNCVDTSRCVDISISPNTQTVVKGNPFQIIVVINPKNIFSVAGIQLDYRFNGGLVNVTGTSEGNFLNRGGSTYFSTGAIDNSNGIISNMYLAALYPGGQISNGTFAYVQMYANNSGNSTITVERALVSDTNGQSLPVRIIPGTVNVNLCSATWDINRDGITDIRDIVLVGQHFGERPPPPYPSYDTNGDGVIDIRDVVIVGQHFGQTTCWR